MSVLLQFWAVLGREEQRAEEKRAGDALFIFVLLLFLDRLCLEENRHQYIGPIDIWNSDSPPFLTCLNQ